MFFFYYRLHPVRDEMAKTAEILCGNHVDFVVAVSKEIGVYWTKTEKHDPDVGMSHWADGRYYAIESIWKDFDVQYKYATQELTLPLVRAIPATTMTQYVNKKQSCDDVPDVHVGNMLYVLSNNKSMRGYSKCSELKPFCSELRSWGRLFRALCRGTCRCAFPDSGLAFLGFPSEGCFAPDDLSGDGEVCSATSWEIHGMLNNRECADVNTTILSQNLASWNMSLKIIANGGRPLSNNKTLAAVVSTKLANHGCAGLMLLTNKTRKKICSSARGIPFFCPASCRCNLANGTNSRDCPSCLSASNSSLSP